MFDNDGSSENNPIDDPFFEDSDLREDNQSEIQKVKDESELCDCDPEHKETQAIQKSRGANLGGFGANIGEGTTVIICKNCGERFYEDDDNSSSGFDSII